MDYQSFRQNYGVDLSEVKYIDIRFTINRAFQQLKFPVSKLFPISRPFQPQLIEIALRAKKGCQPYYRLLSNKSWSRNSIGNRDEKWHNELNCHFSVTFWGQIRKLTSRITFNNNIKWLQFQINRNSLQTNFIVSHFVPTVSPLCKFCNIEPELVSHVFWQCTVVQEFLKEVFTFINSLDFTFKPSKRDFLFGFPDVTFDHPKNYFCLLIKKYIWQAKFNNKNLDINGLKNSLRCALNELQLIYEIIERESLEYNEWKKIISTLSQEDQRDVLTTSTPSVPDLQLSPASAPCQDTNLPHP